MKKVKKFVAVAFWQTVAPKSYTSYKLKVYEDNLVNGTFLAHFSNFFINQCSKLKQFGRGLKYGSTLESGIDVGQGITIGSGKFAKKNKHRAFNIQGA